LVLLQQPVCYTTPAVLAEVALDNVLLLLLLLLRTVSDDGTGLCWHLELHSSKPT
jgi:hypothetical protein